MANPEPGDVVKTMIVMIIIGAVGINILGSPVLSGEAVAYSDVEIVGGDGTIETEFYQTVESVETVETSLEDRVRIKGTSDSNITLETDVALDDTWALCTYATAESSVVSNNESRSIFGVEGATLSYNGTEDVYRLYWFNESSRESYSANVSAPSPSSSTLVCGQHNGTHLTVSRNTTVGSATETSGANIARGPPSSNWNGTIEETRVYDYPLNGSQRQEFVNEPVLAVSGPAPEIRLTYDVRDRSTSSVPAYFASGSGDLNNVDIEDGFSGPSVSSGSDYRIDGDELTVLSGGLLEDNGEVLYVSYKTNGREVWLISLGIALFLLTPLVWRIRAFMR